MLVCNTCGAWFVHPVPTAEEMSLYYNRNADRGIEPELRRWRSNTSQARWYVYLSARIGGYIQHVGHSSGGCLKIADVGAGDLELTTEMARRFPTARITAFDLHHLETGALPADLADRVRTARIDLNRLEDEQPASRADRFDVVVCVSVIEHVIEPLKLLGFLFGIARPGGLVYIVGPDVGSLARKLLGKRWPYYCPRAHLTLPTRASVRIATERVSRNAEALVSGILVRYSMRYLLRYFGMHFTLPRAFDLALPFPAGAFELVWRVPAD